jgi:hypothetical protein
MLYKAIAIILSTILLATVQISTASAGCGGGHGGFRAYPTKSYNKQAFRQSRPSKARVAAVKQKKAVQQAKVEKTEPTKVAKVEKEETKTTDTKADPENELSVASVEQTCTKFIAETGTTIQVECAKQ